MEEQTVDIEVTVKTLDSQSRTYTVGGQVTSSVHTVHKSLVTSYFQTPCASLKNVVSIFL